MVTRIARRPDPLRDPGRTGVGRRSGAVAGRSGRLAAQRQGGAVRAGVALQIHQRRGGILPELQLPHPGGAELSAERRGLRHRGDLPARLVRRRLRHLQPGTSPQRIFHGDRRRRVRRYHHAEFFQGGLLRQDHRGWRREGGAGGAGHVREGRRRSDSGTGPVPGAGPPAAGGRAKGAHRKVHRPEFFGLSIPPRRVHRGVLAERAESAGFRHGLRRRESRPSRGDPLCVRGKRAGRRA